MTYLPVLLRTRLILALLYSGGNFSFRILFWYVTKICGLHLHTTIEWKWKEEFIHQFSVFCGHNKLKLVYHKLIHRPPIESHAYWMSKEGEMWNEIRRHRPTIDRSMTTSTSRCIDWNISWVLHSSRHCICHIYWCCRLFMFMYLLVVKLLRNTTEHKDNFCRCCCCLTTKDENNNWKLMVLHNTHLSTLIFFHHALTFPHSPWYLKCLV